MNAISKDTLYKQARKQAVWAAVWLVLAVVAMIAKPEGDSPSQWLNEQLMFIAGFLMVFQFGRMFQCLASLRNTLSTPSVPAWASLEEEAEAVQRGDNEGYHFQVRDIRAFSSVKEAAQHGWEFGDPIANFGGEPVPRVAKFNGLSYAFDGLAPDQMRSSVPQNQRLFGRLVYKLVETDAPPTPPPPLSMMTS